MTDRPTILVVDDEPNGFAVIKGMLHRDGYNLLYAASGSEALEKLDAIAPDLILLDVMMPDMDGIEVCHRIKSDPSWKHIPIIMVTALNSKEDLARSIEAGADDFLSKPINRLELGARVRSMLRIKQQYDALQATLQIREDMSNMVVHDLKNPVATILIGSHLLVQYSKLQGKELERIERILEAGQQLNSMIDDLLMLAKMESGKIVLNRIDVDLRALAEVVVSSFQEIVTSRGLQLESQLPEAGRWICADVNLLHRLMDNLISNAIKFSPKGGKITLRIEYPVEPVTEGEAPKLAKIQVADEGAGVKPELRQLIFNKYEIGKSFDGISQIGLGLTFCKMVAEAHGGKIFVEDNSPQGSIFTVEI